MRSLRDTLSGSEASCRDFGAKATSSVITVATNLLDTGKEVPVAAAKAGELETLQVIHEPVAGVLACAAEQKLEEQGVSKNILVADLGGMIPGVMLRLSHLWVGCGPFLSKLRIMDLAGWSLMWYLWMTF